MATKKKVAPVAVAPAADASLDDLMGQLAGETKPVSGKKKPAAKRLKLDELPAEVQELVREFVEKKTVFDLVEKPFEAVKNAAKKAVFPLFCEIWWEQQTLPQNPAIELKKEDGKLDHSCMLILSEKFYPQIDTSVDKDGKAPSKQDLVNQCVETLTSLGMDADKALAFVAGELDLNPIQGMHSFSRLSKGYKDGKDWIESSPEEKAVAARIIKWALGQEQEPLTPAERGLAVFVEPNVTVKAGVFQRLRLYAEKPSDLMAMLTLLNPVYYLSKANFAVTDSTIARNERLVDVVADLIGTTAE